MREIKFRAWHKKEQVMFNVGGLINMDYRENHEHRYVTITTGGGRPKDATPQIQEIELMQFTGLLDKNGKEIYEGDIAEIIQPTSITSGEIVFREGAFAFVELKPSTKDTRTVVYLHSVKWQVNWLLEVIGDIYQNKDLLK